MSCSAVRGRVRSPKRRKQQQRGRLDIRTPGIRGCRPDPAAGSRGRQVFARVECLTRGGRRSEVKHPASRVLVAQDLRGWRRERDSNPRYGSPYTRFPSVLLQPLGHLSVSLESAVYRLVAEPGNHNCVTNCVRPLNLARSLTAIWSGLRPSNEVNTNVRLRPPV